jgi:hypothetical protein
MATRHAINRLADTEPSDWQCDICCKTHTAELDVPISLPWETEDHDLVCAESIQRCFQDAIDSGVEFPARWAGVFIDVEHYRSILPDTVYNAYKAKEAAIALEPPTVPTIPDGLTRGVHVQICPGCNKTVDLADGCNHVVCLACLRSFCFLCGEDALGNSDDHWTRGGCPRNGLPGSDRAMFDDDVFQGIGVLAPAQHFRDEDVLAAERRALNNWNAAMQTSDPATQAILRRVTDPTAAELTNPERQSAIAAMGTNNPLTGFSDTEWHAPGTVAFHGLAHRALLDDLLRGRAWDAEFFDPNATVDNSLFLDTGPPDNTLRMPVQRAFDLASPSRNDAYQWMETYLRGMPLGMFPQQSNSAVLSGIPADAMRNVIRLLQLLNHRFDPQQITRTAVVLTISSSPRVGADLRIMAFDLAEGFEAALGDHLEDEVMES